jgi:hypothetical protein
MMLYVMGSALIYSIGHDDRVATPMTFREETKLPISTGVKLEAVGRSPYFERLLIRIEGINPSDGDIPVKRLTKGFAGTIFGFVYAPRRSFEKLPSDPPLIRPAYYP